MASGASSALRETGICVYCVKEIPLNTRFVQLDCNHEVHENCFQGLKKYCCNGSVYCCPLDDRKIKKISYIRSGEIEEKVSFTYSDSPQKVGGVSESSNLNFWLGLKAERINQVAISPFNNLGNYFKAFNK